MGTWLRLSWVLLLDEVKEGDRSRTQKIRATSQVGDEQLLVICLSCIVALFRSIRWEQTEAAFSFAYQQTARVIELKQADRGAPGG